MCPLSKQTEMVGYFQRLTVCGGCLAQLRSSAWAKHHHHHHHRRVSYFSLFFVFTPDFSSSFKLYFWQLLWRSDLSLLPRPLEQTQPTLLHGDRAKSDPGLCLHAWNACVYCTVCVCALVLGDRMNSRGDLQKWLADGEMSLAPSSLWWPLTHCQLLSSGSENESPNHRRTSRLLSHLVVLHGGVVLSYLHVVFHCWWIFLQLQDVDGFLPLARSDGRLGGFKWAAESGPESDSRENLSDVWMLFHSPHLPNIFSLWTGEDTSP